MPSRWYPSACRSTLTHSLGAYLDAIQNGTLDSDIIDRLITDLDAVVAYGEEGDTIVAFSPDQLATLAKVVLDYTTELAKANDVELHRSETPSERAQDGVAVDLRQYLDFQRRILGETA